MDQDQLSLTAALSTLDTALTQMQLVDINNAAEVDAPDAEALFTRIRAAMDEIGGAHKPLPDDPARAALEAWPKLDPLRTLALSLYAARDHVRQTYNTVYTAGALPGETTKARVAKLATLVAETRQTSDRMHVSPVAIKWKPRTR